MKKIFFLLLSLASLKTNAQTAPVGQGDEMLRILQLNGKINAAQSLTARPFYYNKSLTRRDLFNLIDSAANIKLTERSFVNDKIELAVLPASLATKFNSHHPYGWNDAGMIMAKGLQTMVSVGVYAKIGPLSIQLQPEYYYSSNSNYKTTPGYGYNSGKSLNKLYAGQSSVRLNAGPVSVGISSESLWWGPGQFSSIMMSNNAPGFLHYSFNTSRPVKTPIGSFEWQLVIGKLNEDTTAAFENNFMQQLLPKKEDRYFNGIVLTYQPKWLKGFFIGLTRTEQLYKSDQAKKSSFVKKYLPVFVASSPVDNANTTSIPSDGTFSFFARWLLPKHNAEFYAEYGYNDFKKNVRDLTVNTSHAAAYILGFNKLVKSSLLITAEITQMAQTNSYILRSAGNFYVHTPITQGLTYQNQILGAGSGFGNNVQTLQIKKVNGFNTVGVKLQRIQQDPKGIKGPFNLLGMRPLQWNDIALGFLGSKRSKQFIFNAELQLVHSKNYGWEKGNAFNLFAQLNCSYFF